jgi:hypothetical protein
LERGFVWNPWRTRFHYSLRLVKQHPEHCSGEPPQNQMKDNFKLKTRLRFLLVGAKTGVWSSSEMYSVPETRISPWTKTMTAFSQILLVYKYFTFVWSFFFLGFYSSTTQDLWSLSFVLFHYSILQYLFIHPRVEVSLSPSFQQLISIMHFISVILVASAAWAVPFPSASVSQDHFEVLRLRASTTVNPNAVTGTTCLDTTA